MALKSQAVAIFSRLLSYPYAAKRIHMDKKVVMDLLYESTSDPTREGLFKTAMMSLCSVYEHTKNEQVHDFLLKYIEENMVHMKMEKDGAELPDEQSLFTPAAAQGSPSQKQRMHFTDALNHLKKTRKQLGRNRANELFIFKRIQEVLNVSTK